MLPKLIGARIAAPLVAFALALVACSEAEEDLAPVGAGTTDTVRTTSALASPALSPPPDPFITENGYRQLIPVTRGANLCEADGSVMMLDGRIVGEPYGPPSFAVSPDEAVYHKDGSLFNEPVLVGTPVNRRPDGKLEAGWRHCEFIPDSTGP